jgi:HNH endonuclease
MSVSAAARRLVRQRAAYACEYCGVAEHDTGGELTVDHHFPQSLGGTDEVENLIYACQRCNLYKSDFWPATPEEPALWNPRTEPREQHLLNLADGTLYPLTAVGTVTIAVLRLNRPPLIAHRRRRIEQAEETRLLTQLFEVVALLEQLQRQHSALLADQHALLEQQRTLLAILLAERG